MIKKIWNWIAKNEGLILLLLIVVVLRIPSLYEPYWYGDEGIYLVLGQAFKKGLVFYRDIHDNKPPLLYLLAGLAGNVFWFRLILMGWMTMAVMVFFRLMQLFFPKNKPAWYISSLLLIVMTTLTEGNIANAEIFVVLPITAAMLLIYQTAIGKTKKIRNKKLPYFLSGILFSIGFLLKVPAGFDLAAIIIWLLVEKKKFKKILLLLAGFLLPIVITIIYYAIMGGLEIYVRSALLQNIGYLSSWETSQSGLLSRAGILSISLVIFYGLAKKFKLSSAAKLSVIWFLMALFAALLSERPYPHYLIQAAIPAAILITWLLFGKKKLLKLIILVVALGTGWFYYQIKFWNYPVISYYQNFIDYSRGKKSRDDYRSFFDWRVNQTYQVAEYLRRHTLPEERIFIWGDEPYIYALAERLPIGRYTVAYHVVDFNGFQETLDAWQQKQPKVVVVMEYEKRNFPEMKAWLNADYLLTEKIDQALIYMKLNGINNL